MSIETPVIMPFYSVDANEYFYVEYAGDPLSTTDDRFFYWRFIITNLDTNETTEYPYGLTKINRTGSVTIENYLDPLYSDGTRKIPVGVWMAVNKNYYFCFPKNYVYNDKLIFENGCSYSIQIAFDTEGADQSDEVVTVEHYFKCCANFKVALENYQYNNDTPIIVTQEDTTIPYEITVAKSFCKLNFSYTQEDGESLLKYYQFFLYNDDGVLLGESKKIYGIPDSGIMYAIENYNNLQHYVLKLYCETQDNRNSITTIYIYTDYQQESIYADISFLLDTENATNNISISVKELNGEGEGYYFKDGEYVEMIGDGYVNFTDTYQTISNNFLCRLWCKFSNIREDVPILTIRTANNTGYIEVFFTGKYFIARKYSCNIATSYISNVLTEVVDNTQDIYFALGYYNGRIEMYTTLI